MPAQPIMGFRDFLSNLADRQWIARKVLPGWVCGVSAKPGDSEETLRLGVIGGEFLVVQGPIIGDAVQAPDPKV
jgi:hypothetical protein